MAEQNKSERQMGVWLVGFGVVVCVILVGVFLIKKLWPETVVSSGVSGSDTKVEGSAKPQAATKAVIGRWQRDNARGKLVQKKPAPAIEGERVSKEAGGQDTVKLAHDFEGCGPAKLTKISPTHFEIEMPENGLRNWFLFRVDGAAGKVVRFDIVKPVMTHWWSLNPVYSDGLKSLDEQDLISVVPTTGSAEKVVAYNTPELPDTRGQKWKFVSNVWVEGDPQKLCFAQKFEKDGVYVAFRYPCTPGYEQGFMTEVARSSAAKVVVVGKTRQGRDLNVVVIGDQEARKPCAVVEARNHANDQDAGWVANGLISFLISNEPEAQYIRGKFNFIVIPMIDPDAAASGTNFGIGDGFGAGRMSNGTGAGTVGYANFFENWAAKDGRIDVVLALYGVESAESPHLACPEVSDDPYRREHDLNLYDQLMQLCADRYVINPKPWGEGIDSERMEGWLADHFGTLGIMYMPNSQDAQRHLSLAELADLGRQMALSTTLYLDSEDGGKLMEEIDMKRGDRKERMDKLGSELNGLDGLRAEAVITGQRPTRRDMMAATQRAATRPTTRATTRPR